MSLLRLYFRRKKAFLIIYSISSLPYDMSLSYISYDFSKVVIIKAIDYLFIVVKQKRDEAHENQSENARNENPRLRSREGYAWRRGPVKRGRPCLRRYATD